MNTSARQQTIALALTLGGLGLVSLAGCWPRAKQACGSLSEVCDPNATCIRQQGTSPYCACDDGFVGDGKTCAPGVTCGSQRQTCDTNATCVEQGSDKRCVCNAGYVGDGTSCAPGGGCGNQGFECDPHATCTAEGRCVCGQGYTGDGRTCSDLDECAAGTAGCDPHATCKNTTGSFSCACSGGWTGDGMTCSDIDECNAGISSCSPNATCANKEGGYDCTCKEGYTGDGQTCADLDECQSGAAKCGANADCKNKPGTFECACKEGFTGDGQTCTDVDECASVPPVCDVQATCSNTPGSFDCACKPGYQGSGKGSGSCTDIDECQASPGPCLPGLVAATCQNTAGSFACVCPSGYRYHQGCVDIDECAEGADNCSTFADCTNSQGAFTCACKAGFKDNTIGGGKGLTCDSIDPLDVTVTVPNPRPVFATIRAGWSINLSGNATCPVEPCPFAYLWDFGDGTTSDTQSPGLRSYAQPGMHRISVTVTDTINGLEIGKRDLYLAVWNGTLTDDFDRATVDWDARGWVAPVQPGIVWDLQQSWLHVDAHPIHAPGSTGVLSYPLVRNGHVEATVARCPRTEYWHYTDVLVRQHPVDWNGKFYRIRLLQSGEGFEGGNLQLAVFRIDHPTDEHGILLNDPQHKIDYGTCTLDADCDQYITAGHYVGEIACRDGICRPIQPWGVPRLTSWDPNRQQDVRIIADVRDIGTPPVPQFHIKFVDPASPSTVFLEQTFTDQLPDPFTHAGVWGLTSFEGDARFDNYVLTELR